MKRIVVDTSTGCLDYFNHGYNIPVIRINLYFGEESYQDGVDIKSEEFYERLQREKSLPQTSQPSIGYLYDFFNNLCEQGYEEVIVECSEEFKEAVLPHQDYISNEVRTANLEFDDISSVDGYTKEWKIEEEQLKIFIKE